MPRSKKFLSVIMSVVLVVALMPIPASAEQAAEADIAAASIEGTPGVDYAEGEVLVAVRGGAEALAAETSTGAFGLLSGSANQAGSSSFTIGETLATVSANDIANAAEDVGTSDEVDLEAGTGSMGLQSIDLDADDIEIIDLKCEDVAQAIADLQKLDCVVLAEPCYYYQLTDDEETDAQVASTVSSAMQDNIKTASSTSTLGLESADNPASGTSEPFYTAQWSLQSDASLAASGYTGTTSLDAEDAWAEGAGDEENGDVVVAVVDLGVDYTHEDLAENMWAGGEADWSTALGGGKYGINTSKDGDRNDPMGTKDGHGTHTASTIAAAWNGIGIAGVNNKVEIMACRALPGSAATAIPAYNYIMKAKENGVDVVAISNSWGPTINIGARDTLMDAVIYKAGTEGIISVFAACNLGSDNDLVAGFHFNNSNPYLLNVGAVNSSGEAANFSDYGKLSVDVFSPGSDVLAATSSYGVRTGTTIGTGAEYLPWLKGSASAKSAYFLDDAESTTGPDGITYDLVAYDEYFNFTHISDPVTLNKGYDNAGVNNQKSLKFNLEDASGAIAEGLSPAVRITIPYATWEKYKAEGHGDDLYFACVGDISGTGYTDPYVKPYVKTTAGWEKLTNALECLRDFQWCRLQTKTSVTELDNGKGENGDVTILLEVNGLGKTTFTDDDYVYLDNISLGWATCSGAGTAAANDTYAYDDGTSMATPNVTGVVSLLCSRAKATSNDPANYDQSAETAREIISFTKGGVTQLSSLSDKCGTGGVANAYNSYKAYKAYTRATTDEAKIAATADLKPTPDSITNNGDGTSTLSGSFFGAQQGTVSFNGAQLEVVNWTDSAITFKSLSCSKEQVGKVIVTKAKAEGSDAGISGQDYLILPAGSSSAKSFDALPTPDFNITVTYTSKDGYATTFEANANEAEPERMTATDGFVYVYAGLNENTVPVLLRYDIATSTWDTKNYLEGFADKFNAAKVDEISMAAGTSEIYIKHLSTDGKTHLMTLDAETGAVKRDIEISASTNTLGSLGFLKGKLYLVGGMKGEPACVAIYPDTGSVYWTAETALPTNAICGNVTSCGFGFEITGSFSSRDRNGNGYKAGVLNNQIDISMPNENMTICNVSSAVFFPQTDTASQYGLDDGQPFLYMGVAAADGAAIVTGPVRNNEGENMVDTWIYSAQSCTWTAVTNARFAPTAECALCACTYKGIYYVMATDMQQEGVTQRFQSYPIADWGLSDEMTAPTSNALTFAESALIGDANDDKAVTIMDAQITLDMANGTWTDKTAYDKLLATLDNGWNESALTIVADVNKDEAVNADDARAIQNYVHTGAFKEVA